MRISLRAASMSHSPTASAQRSKWENGTADFAVTTLQSASLMEHSGDAPYTRACLCDEALAWLQHHAFRERSARVEDRR